MKSGLCTGPAIAALCLMSLAADGTPSALAPDQALSKRVTLLLKQLSDGAFQERIDAEEALAHVPIDALPLLEAAMRDPKTSVDVRERLQPQITAMRKNAPGLRQMQAARLADEFYARRLQHEYDEHGQHGPWDKSVAEGIQRRFVVSDTLYGRPAHRRAQAAFQAALDAGCQDPLVRMLLVFTRVDDDPHADEALLLLKEAPDQLAARHYPTGLTAMAYFKRAQARVLVARNGLTQEVADAAEKDSERAIPLFAAADVHDLPWMEWSIWMVRETAIMMTRFEEGPAGPRLRDILDTMLKGKEPSFAAAARLEATNAAMLETARGFNARFRRIMDDTTVRELLTAAEQAASAPRFAADPLVLKSRYAAAAMRNDILKCAQIFEKQVELEPAAYSVFESHLQTISRLKEAELLRQFSNRVKVLKGPDPRLPLLAADAEWNRAVFTLSALPQPGTEANAELWSTFSAVYEPYLELVPNDVVAHAHYAWYAFKFGQFEIAKKHFDAAGDDGDDPITPSLTVYDYARRKAARKLEK